MARVIDKLWNWGHLEGSHNKCVGVSSSMSPEEYAAEYGISNAFIVSYGGNIQPPYHELAKRMSSLKRIKWSVLGDASTPLPEDELGNTNDVIAAAKSAKNIDGAVVDDFFSPARIERFTPAVLKKMQSALNANDLDFQCVLYAHELDEKLIPYLDCFDGVTFWIWECADTVNAKEYYCKLKALTKDIPVMLGVYLWNYAKRSPMDTELFRNQLAFYFDLLEKGEIEGIIFCSSTIGDADLETNRIVKEFILEHGSKEIKD